jgi:hypothetical protein
MKRSKGITSVESRAMFHEEAFEDFINSAMPGKTLAADKKTPFSADFKNIEWCGAYVPFNGTVDILSTVQRTDDIKRLSIPVSSSFLVICTKEEEGKYKIAWSCSMS